MRLTSFFTSLLLLLSIISGCKKSGDEAGIEPQPELKDNFSFTLNGGKTYTATYVPALVPSSNGTFTLQYKKFGINGSQWNFFVFIDKSNEFNLDVIIPEPIVNGTTYFTNRNTDVLFSGSINNASLNVSKTDLIFEKSTYPGNIVGSFKAYTANNTLVGTGKFNFEVK